jgi:hypothetical protein
MGLLYALRHARCLAHQGIASAYFWLNINLYTDLWARLITVGRSGMVNGCEDKHRK